MDITIADLPNWTFNGTEVSVGVYKVKGTHLLGPTIELTGTDEDILLREVAEAARKLKFEVKWREPVVTRNEKKGPASVPNPDRKEGHHP
jgi:hypothetical protein